MLLALIITLYRALPARLKTPCPQSPTCSAWSLAAARRLGSVRGAVAAWDRVAACSVCKPSDLPRPDWPAH